MTVIHKIEGQESSGSITIGHCRFGAREGCKCWASTVCTVCRQSVRHNLLLSAQVKLVQSLHYSLLAHSCQVVVANPVQRVIRYGSGAAAMAAAISLT
jgi:hypothetical protein